MVIIGNQNYRVMVGNTMADLSKKESLPEGVVKVEYLESTGTLYIDTGIQFNQDTDFYAEFAVTQEVVNTNTTFFEVWSSGNGADTSYGLMNLPENNTFLFRRMGRVWINNFLMQANTKYKFRSDANKIYIDEVLKGTGGTPTFQQNYNTILFARKDGPHSYLANKGITPFKGIICYCFKIYQSGILIRDFIPVRISLIGYMYDKVSGQLFGNSGTGSFTLGKDITTVHDYVTDGLVFHLDGIEKGATDGSWIDLVGGKVFTANNSTYIQPAVDGFTFIDGSNAFNAMTYSNGLVGTTTWTMESACSPTAWNTGAIRALFTSSNRGCGLSLRGNFHWSSGSNKGWENNILSQQLPKVTLSMNADMGVLNGEQLTTTKGGEQMTTAGFQVGSCQNKNYNFVGTIHSIRMYNRSLTLEERLHNQRIDNIRFNLGLNI